MENKKLTNTEQALRNKLNEVNFSPDASDWANLSSRLASAQKPWYASQVGKIAIAAIALGSIFIAYQTFSDSTNNGVEVPIESPKPKAEIKVKSNTKTTVKEKVEEADEESPNISDEENSLTQISDSIFSDSSQINLVELPSDSTIEEIDELASEEENITNELLDIAIYGNPCIGEELELKGVFKHDEKNSELSWEVNQKPIKKSSSNLLLSLDNAGTYLIKASLGEQSVETEFTVEKAVEIDFLYEDLKDAYRDQTVRLKATPAELDYRWDIEGFDNNIEGNDIMVDLDKTGVFEVELIHESEAGCIYSTSKPISIQTNFKTLAPTHFTPDGDGLNDTFIPEGFKDVEGDFKFYIYNEVGKLVYLSNSKDLPWNGRENNNGAKLSEGIYVWKVEISNKSLHKAFTGKIRISSF